MGVEVRIYEGPPGCGQLDIKVMLDADTYDQLHEVAGRDGLKSVHMLVKQSIERLAERASN